MNKTTLAIDTQVLEDMMPYASIQEDAISSKGIDWHIDHSCRVILNVGQSLQSSKPEDYIQNVSPQIVALFKAGVIPRGTAQAPPFLMAEGDISKEELERQLAKTKQCLAQIQRLSQRHHFVHPYFGMLNLEMALQFLDIHTKHHTKIMKDIMKHNAKD